MIDIPVISAGRSAVIHLLQPVDKIQPLRTRLGEIDNDVGPFRDASRTLLTCTACGNRLPSVET